MGPPARRQMVEEAEKTTVDVWLEDDQRTGGAGSIGTVVESSDQRHSVSNKNSSNQVNTGQDVGPGGPGGACYPQGSGVPHDKWKGGATVPPSTGLRGSLQNPRSGETYRSGGGMSSNGPSAMIKLSVVMLEDDQGAETGRCDDDDMPSVETCIMSGPNVVRKLEDDLGTVNMKGNNI